MAEFKLGRIKFVWKGAWQATTNYYKDDVVSYGGNSYICIVSHTSSSTLTANQANWQVLAGGTDWKGQYAPATFYKVGDIVDSGANLYICRIAYTSGASLEDNIANWDLYVASVNFRGAWTTATIYTVNDLVKYGANVYITNTKHTSTATFDIVKFNQFVEGLSFEDSWNSGQFYAIGDIVTYGGYVYICTDEHTNQTPSAVSTYWDVFTTGFNVIGTWNTSTTYKTGDVVQYGGYSYVSKVDSTNQTPYIGTSGVNSGYWNLVVKGLNPTGSWTTSTIYAPGDIVEKDNNSYIAKGVSLNQMPPNFTYWSVLSQGSVGAVLTERGDLAYRTAAGAVVGLSMSDGTSNSNAVQEGFVLKAVTINDPTSALEPRYAEFGYVANVWYVAPSGTDAVGYGRTIDRPFATVKYASEQATGPATVFVKTGTYAEQLPIRVPPGVTIIGDEVRSVNITPAAGLSSDGITPNNRQKMFLMNNGSTIRNLTMSGLTGQFDGVQNPAGSGVQRVTTNWPSATASGAFVAFDPTGTISSRSPYVQNCSSFGTRCIGVWANGNDHAGGYKSFVLNDFTQIIDDGIAIWAKNGSRIELVSVFTYYAYIGYLAESGGILRALNGNNSYGTYGGVSVDLDPTDLGFTGAVDNRSTEATVGRVLVGEGRITAVLWDYMGQNYTTAAVTFEGAPTGGTTAVATTNFTNGALSHVNITNAGSGYQYITGTGRQGGTNVGGVWFALAATDGMTSNNQYQGMRIIITEGVGSGQTGVIKSSFVTDGASGFTRVVYVQNESAVDGWESLTGDPIITALDQSSKYEIVARITVTTAGYSPTTVARVFAQISPETNTLSGAYILNGGAGYLPGNLPSFTITDPGAGSAATMTAQIKDGAISSLTYSNRGAGYVTASVTSVTGNGFAEIAQFGTAINFLGMTTKAPRPGSIMTIAGQPGNFLVIQTNTYNAGTGAANVSLSPSIDRTTPVTQGALATVYEKFSQIRLTGHDYLAIGTGNFASTAYPGVSTLNYIKNNEKKSLNNGRVFYVSTDQDGNLSVGDLFQVNQATGQATLNVSAFNLTGLNSLQLGSTGATVFSFSTDGTMSANSDQIVPTQRAIRSYINSQLGSGSNSLTVNVLNAGKIFIENETITTGAGTNSDMILDADGTGKITVSANIEFVSTFTGYAALSGNHLANKNYVDGKAVSSMHGFTLDSTGALIYTTELGSEALTINGSAFTEFFLASRDINISITANGNLQITYN